MEPLGYETPPSRPGVRTVAWAAGCFFAGAAVTSAVGALIALLSVPTPSMLDAPPVMVICPLPLAAGFVALLTYAFAALLRWLRGGWFVSRGTGVSVATGAVVGLVIAAMPYAPDPPALVGALVMFVAVPLASAVVIARPWQPADAAPTR